MTIYVVTIVETHTGFKCFESEEDARNWMKNPEEDYEDITWTNCDIEEMELKEETE